MKRLWAKTAVGGVIEFETVATLGPVRIRCGGPMPDSRVIVWCWATEKPLPAHLLAAFRRAVDKAPEGVQT